MYQMQSTSQRGIIATIVSKSIVFSKLLDTIGLQKVINNFADFAIRDYQRYISPHKGFSCAHSKLYGEASCSTYFRQSLATEGLSKTLELFPDRLTECHKAGVILRSQRFGSKKEGEGKNKKISNTEESNCGFDTSGCCDFSYCDTNHNGSCDGGDCSGCDGGGCDVGGCDCNL